MLEFDGPKIFVAHHREFQVLENEILTPIHVGAAGSSAPLGMLRDDAGDNISEKNTTWCELTGMYWVWRNVRAPYYGFCHYRRYFDFGELHRRLDTERPIPSAPHSADPATGGAISANSLCDPAFATHAIENMDIIIPALWDFGQTTIAMQYAQCHNMGDLVTAMDVVNEVSPWLAPNVDRVLSSTALAAYNMFVMGDELFQQYMGWLYEVLTETERRITVSEDPYQRRVFGFLAERLLNIFVSWHADQGARVGLVPTIFIDPEVPGGFTRQG